MSNKSRILVVRNGAIGDTVLLTPVLHGLRSSFPDHEILVLGQYERVSLLVGPSFATRALSFDQPGIHTLYSPQPMLPPETHDLFAASELILWYGEDHEGLLSRNLRRICSGRVVLYAPRPTGGEHITDHLLQVLDRISVPRPHSVPPLETPLSMPVDLQELLSDSEKRGRLLVLHPGAASLQKCLAPETWAEALHALSQVSEIQPVVLSGPEEEDRGMTVCAKASRLGPLLVHNRPLLDVAALLKNADLFLGHDSGITHLAAAVGCRTVAVFRSTDPAVWSPPGEQVRIIQVREKREAVQRIAQNAAEIILSLP